MSIEAMNWALEQKTGSPAAKSVLLILANRADNKGICWPGLAGISRQTELSKRAVINNIRKLESGGFLTYEMRRQPLTNLYVLNLSGSERGALVNEVHGERGSLEVVNVVHPGSERGAPEPSLTINKPKKTIRGSKRVPKNFTLTEDLVTYAIKIGMEQSTIEMEFEGFKDCEFKTAKKDWPATWRTWCRNWKKFGGTNEAHKRSGDFNDIHARNRKAAGLD